MQILKSAAFALGLVAWALVALQVAEAWLRTSR